MSTHRKIEWSLFILGLVGVGVSLWYEAAIVQTILFVAAALFAGLHVFHLYDGHKANHIVMATSVALVAYVGYQVLADFEDSGVVAGLIVAVLLLILSLRLRRDFHPKSL